MNKQRKQKRQHTNETLRNAKRSGMRVYPAFNDSDAFALVESLGNGNGRTLPASNYDNV